MNWLHFGTGHRPPSASPKPDSDQPLETNQNSQPSNVTSQMKKCTFQHEWCGKYPWIKYENEKNCKVCWTAVKQLQSPLLSNSSTDGILLHL